VEINVRVAVIPDDKRPADGVVRTDVPIDQIRADVVDALKLGDPGDWDVAVLPSNPKATLSQYTPSDGDTLLLIRKSVSRGKSFKLLQPD